MASFTPQQTEQFLREFFDVVGTRQYIGARYVPIFGRRGESSIAWDNSAPYEPLTIVVYQGNSYTSRTYVPAGIQISDTQYWALTGNYNAQIEQYRQELLNVVDEFSDATSAALNSVQRDQANVEYEVGPTGDFETINAALTHIRTYRPPYMGKVTITLQVGYVMREQVVADGVDLGYITITGNGNTIDGSYVTTQYVQIPSHSQDASPINLAAAFTAVNGGILPVIDDLFTFDPNKANAYGLAAALCGQAVIKDGAGFIGGRVNVYAVENANVNAMGAVLTGATGASVFCFRSSTITLWGADLSDSEAGIYLDSDSSTELSQATISNVTTYAARLDNSSTCVVERLVIDGCGTDGLTIAGNAVVYGSHMSISNCTGTGIKLLNNDVALVCMDTTITGCGTAVNCVRSNFVGSGSISECSRAFYINSGSVTFQDSTIAVSTVQTAIDMAKATLNMENVTFTNTAAEANENNITIKAINESTINVRHCVSSGGYKFIVAEKSTIRLTRCGHTARNVIVEANDSDVSVIGGSLHAGYADLQLTNCKCDASFTDTNTANNSRFLFLTACQAHIYGCTFSGSDNKGIELRDCKFEINETTITNATTGMQINRSQGSFNTVAVSGGTYGIVADGCIMNGSSMAVKGHTTYALQLSNTIFNCSASVFTLNADGATTDNNDIRLNTSGFAMLKHDVVGGTTRTLNTFPTDGSWIVLKP